MALLLLTKPSDNPPSQQKLSWTTEPSRVLALPTTRILNITHTTGAVVVIFNPTSHTREEVVSVLVGILPI